MSTRTLNSKRNIIVGVLSNLMVPVFAMIVNSAIVKNFSVEYVGLSSVFSSVFEVLNLAELGFSSAIIFNLYKPIKEHDIATVRGILAYFRRVYMIIGLTVLLAGLLVLPFLNFVIKDTSGISENIYVLYIIYLLEKAIRYMLFAHKEALLNSVQRFDLIKTVYIIVYFTRSMLELIAIVVLKNFYLYAFSLVIGAFLYYVFLDLVSKNKYGEYFPEGKIDEVIRRNIREQVMGLSVSNVVGVSRNSLKALMISSFLSLYVAGQYSNYYTIFNAVLGFFLVITKAIQASIGNSIVSDTPEKNYSDLTKMEFLHNIVITVCTAYLISLYQPFMKLWMGEELMFSDPVMMLFVLNFYILAMSEVRNAFFSALGYWWKARWLFAIEAGMNIILLYVLGKLFGVTGIVVATVITLLFVNYIGITNLMFKEYFGAGRKEYYINRVIYTVITMITGGTAYIICGMISMDGIPGLIVRGVCCTLVLVILVPSLLFIFRREYMKDSVGFIKQIIKA